MASLLLILRALYLDLRIYWAEQDISGYQTWDNPPEGILKGHRHAVQAWRVERATLEARRA
jgi:hypothetical protein